MIFIELSGRLNRQKNRNVTVLKGIVDALKGETEAESSDDSLLGPDGALLIVGLFEAAGSGADVIHD